MPGPLLTKALAIAKFQSYRIQLPPQAKVAPGGGLRLVTGSGMPAAGRPAAGPAEATPAGVRSANSIQMPPALFLSASNSVSDVDIQKVMHDGYMELFDKLTEAITYAWNTFRQKAFFVNIKISAVSAVGPPGCLSGPVIEQLIRTAPSVAGWVGWWAGIRDGVAAGFQNSWQDWQNGVTVPGLPWYPAFAAFPGPMAPPMPNVPTPLITCVSAGVVSMTPIPLKSNLARKLSGMMDYHEQFSDSLSMMIAPAFTAWLPFQQVTNVLGQGPVPTFAPPYVPVGPVVNGSVVSNPGCLAT